MFQPATQTLAGPRAKRDVRSRDAVLKVAKSLRAGKPSAAFGRCLALSLEMAGAAQARGVEVELVVWSVAGDPNFLDHWAVAVGESKVIDLTRVQVDGRTGLLYDIDDYPANFLRRRRYPAWLLTPALAAHGAARDGQFSARFVWAVRWLMFRHDLGRAMMLRDAPLAGRSILSVLKFGLVRAARRLEAALKTRREELMARVHAVPADRHSTPRYRS